MTKQDWEIVEKRLNCYHCSVDLMCDGYRVTLRLERVSNFKMAIKVYVNGWMKGEWLGFNGEASDEGLRFFPKRFKYLYTKKERDRYQKIPKKIRISLKIDIDKKYEYRGFWWGSFKLMKAHFIKNNKSIELVREGVTQALIKEHLS